jgi:hypothetical protein
MGTPLHLCCLCLSYLAMIIHCLIVSMHLDATTSRLELSFDFNELLFSAGPGIGTSSGFTHRAGQTEHNAECLARTFSIYATQNLSRKGSYAIRQSVKGSLFASSAPFPREIRFLHLIRSLRKACPIIRVSSQVHTSQKCQLG